MLSDQSEILLMFWNRKIPLPWLLPIGFMIQMHFYFEDFLNYYKKIGY